MTTQLAKVLSAIDSINAQDPNQIIFNNVSTPKELAYSQQMSACLAQYWPDANELLKIAVHAQHIQRWQLKRSDYPEGKAGYYSWRIAQGKHHAQLTMALMLEQGYSDEQAQVCGAIIRKENLKSNSDTQTLEDVACLVFLSHYFDEFAATYIAQDNEAKVVRIVKLTWGKMSEQAHTIALGLTLPEHLAALVAKALN
ncbi:DUF4202 domain-containing protein [Colwellia sp. D2M02]|uniref:DUF4202 domain-containing protein n=1 Tax=Colwellia sp. D2M02 TaxID=2841562 RepID=UPI001C091DA5|nr:DUF4202 domain-containing protein [Colwellia sp. D2M02]MBU2894454.1 DUF4202 domain-containing protein [Colwellia sp. D2M02]